MDVVPENPAFTPTGITMPQCPACGQTLLLGSAGTLNYWACPELHGLGLSLTSTHDHLQDDEISQMWQKARAGVPGPVGSPFDGRPMVRVLVEYDSDEVPEGEQGDGPTEGTVEVDVDLENEFIWFDAGEIDEMPYDLPDAEPTAEEQAAIAEITTQFSASMGAALEARDDGEFTEKVYQHIAKRPGLARALDKVGRAVTTY